MATAVLDGMAADWTTARLLEMVDVELGGAGALDGFVSGARRRVRVVPPRLCVQIVSGSVPGVCSLRDRVSATALFVSYPHRVSLAVVGRDALGRSQLRRAACDAAGAVAFFDQRGCVSPQVVYVEEGGEASPAQFAAELQQLQQEIGAGDRELQEQEKALRTFMSAYRDLFTRRDRLAAETSGLESRIDAHREQSRKVEIEINTISLKLASVK